MESQWSPAVTCTVKTTPAGPDALVYVDRSGLPGWIPVASIKVSEVGDTVTFPELPPPLVVTVNVTGTV